MDDETFLAQFESAALPLADWHHRQHLKVAYLYLRRHPFERALERMRSGIRAYNAAHHVPEGPTRGYHETMTRAWLHLVHLTLCEFGPSGSADEFVDQHPQLQSMRALLFFYSRDLIMSLRAKHDFLAPDLAPLPRSAREHSPLEPQSSPSRSHGALNPKPGDLP